MKNKMIFILSWYFLIGTYTVHSQNRQIEYNNLGLIGMDSSQVLGAGFICSHQNLITTCAHIFERSGNKELFTYRTKSGDYIVKIVYKSFDRDIAILKLDSVIVDTPLSLTERFKFKLKDSLALAGYDVTESQLQNQYTINMSLVYIEGYRDEKHGDVTRRFLEFYGIAQPGYSGGPLFAMDGKVCAILHGGMPNVKNPRMEEEILNFAIVLDELHDIYDFLALQGIMDE